MREDDLVDGADGGGEDDDRVEGLLHADAAREDGRVGEPHAHAVAVQALVQLGLRKAEDVAAPPRFFNITFHMIWLVIR